MSASAGKRVQIHYYALLREQRGTAQELLVTSARSLRQLYLELSEQHRFSLSTEKLRVAVNDQLQGWDDPLQDNDRVVFIPPVAGG